MSNQSASILPANEKRVHALLSLVVDIYLQLLSDPNLHKWKVHDPKLGANIATILTILFNNGSPSNVKVAAQKLKVKQLKHSKILLSTVLTLKKNLRLAVWPNVRRRRKVCSGFRSKSK